MPRISAPRVGMSNQVSIASNGIFTFPRRVIERVGWIHSTRISVDYLIDRKIDDFPLVLFLNVDKSADGKGFTLSPLGGNASLSGGKISCSLLTRMIIAPRVSLPITNIDPIYPVSNLADLILMLTEPKWKTIEFTMAGAMLIGGSGEEVKGTYELLGTNGTILRVGEGNIQSRVREHLKDERILRHVRQVRYFPVTEKNDAEVMEQILLARYETHFGKLPILNSIRA